MTRGTFAASRGGRSEAPSPSPANPLQALARRVARLSPSRHDPEAFFIERDEIRAALVRLARREAA